MSYNSVKSEFAPTGRLRATINLGNPILAHSDTKTGEVSGVSVDLAHLLAQRLGLPIELVVLDAAGKAVQAVAQEQADVGFFAVDPLRGQEIAFTSPYLLIEGCYLVRQDSPLQSNLDVDQPGNRVVVGRGSAYDLYLSREIKQAQIVHAPTSPEVVDVFVAQGLEVAAGVKQQLQSDQNRFADLRLLPGRFMTIQQAMGLPKSRSDIAAAYLVEFVEDVKASGFVAMALKRHGIEGASVAPQAPSAGPALRDTNH
ncbi:HisJ ABC-type amino acid transport/signal transduction systems, periplasmic component/domain [Burkholderiaceae bacterium]